MTQLPRRDQIREHEEEMRRCRFATPAIAPDALTTRPHELVPRGTTAESIEGWKAVANTFLTDQACAFHRNLEISSRYAWIHDRLPDCFKWAGMAAIASHHVRLALFPLRLDTDDNGFVDIQKSLGRRKFLLMQDVNTVRATNNAIFNDIFWVHLAYLTSDHGLERLRALLQAEPHYAPVLKGFEAIDEGRCVLESTTVSVEARRRANELIWEGNVQLLEHEQRALVQPNFDTLSCAFARLVSLGSATRFDTRGARHEAEYFTSFYLYSLTRGFPKAVHGRAWPRMTRLEDRWDWLVASVVPRFKRFDSNARLVNASLQRIFHEAREYAAKPCVPPRPLQAEIRGTADR